MTACAVIGEVFLLPGVYSKMCYAKKESAKIPPCAMRWNENDISSMM